MKQYTFVVLALAAFVAGPCHADGPPPAPTAMAATSATLSEGDGDGDELLEHWGDPQYSHEERFQLGGLIVLLAAAGGAAYRRSTVLRRTYRND